MSLSYTAKHSYEGLANSILRYFPSSQVSRWTCTALPDGERLYLWNLSLTCSFERHLSRLVNYGLEEQVTEEFTGWGSLSAKWLMRKQVWTPPTCCLPHPHRLPRFGVSSLSPPTYLKHLGHLQVKMQWSRIGYQEMEAEMKEDAEIEAWVERGRN